MARLGPVEGGGGAFILQNHQLHCFDFCFEKERIRSKTKKRTKEEEIEKDS